MTTYKLSMFVGRSRDEGKGYVPPYQFPEPDVLSKDWSQNCVYLNTQSVRSDSLQQLYTVGVAVNNVFCDGRKVHQHTSHLPLILLARKDLPKDYAFVYKSALLLHLNGVNQNSLTHASLKKATITIHPFQLLVPAQTVALRCHSSTAGLSEGCITDYMKKKFMTASRPVVTPHLLKKESRVFMRWGARELQFDVCDVTQDDTNLFYRLKYISVKIQSLDSSLSQNLISRYCPEELDASSCDVDPVYYVTERTQLKLVTDDLRKVDADSSDEILKSIPYLERTVNALKGMMIKIMNYKIKLSKNPWLTTSGIIVHGPYFACKSAIVKRASELAGFNFIELSLNDLPYDKQDYVSLLDQAKSHSPAVAFIRRIHSHFKRDTKYCNENLGNLVLRLQEIKDCKVILVCTTETPEVVDPGLFKALSHSFYVPLPELKDRIDVIRYFVKHFKETDTFSKYPVNWNDENITELARAAYGCTVEELKQQVYHHFDLAMAEDSSKVSNISSLIPKSFVPRNNRNSSLSLLGGLRCTDWSSVKGYTAIKSAMQDMISLYRNNPIDHPLQGLLLYGAPGCSKTMLVRALVTETRFTLCTLKGSDYLCMYVGETEKHIKSVFEQAFNSAPSILFIDELDSLCEARGRNEGGNDLISVLKENMERCCQPDGGFVKILLVGATNRPTTIDESLLQRGFFERVVHVDLPNCEDRCTMWRHKINSCPTRGHIDVSALCAASLGFSGAEIEESYRTAVRTMKNSRFMPAWRSHHEYELSKFAYPKIHPPEEVCNLVYLTQEELMEGIRKCLPPRTDPQLLQESFKFSKRYKNMMLVT